eukprot:CAMPEP_0172905296 /NCGR_PEP_ID=MMETSP1075-20121228/174360_1 /TAXON_ID=2916 /ORGANISM="Ceratium fusus, Strain PA161109" /LENGTH=556 /DNA_ID=CAMNT_0013762501 /DNA_START=16 /DNA_END=1683 /DNA_ORIENTATION=-
MSYYGATVAEPELLDEEDSGDKLIRSMRRTFSTVDLPVLALPWLLFTINVLPTALLKDRLLGNIMFAATFVLALNFLLLSRASSWKILAAKCMLAAVLAEYLGQYDRSKYVDDLAIYSNSALYENVQPTSHPGSFKDAAWLQFSADAHVDATKGVGYQSGHLWCAAPIIGSSHEAGLSRTVGFWAVGMDCCRYRGMFSCGDVWNLTKHTGLVVLEKSALSSSEFPMYMKAAKMGAEVYGFGIPAEPTLVRWDVPSATVQKEALTSAISFAVVAVITYLLLVPVSMIVLNLLNLPLIDRKSAVLKDISFGISPASKRYNAETVKELMENRCYYTGSVMYDYAYHLANKHLFIGMLFCHPAHPFSKMERLFVAVIVSALVVFPVSAFSVQFGQTGLLRTLIILVGVTLPRNLLKLYLIRISQADVKLELSGAVVEEKDVMSQWIFQAVVMVLIATLTIIICMLCTQFISNRSEESLSTVLGRNGDGLCFMFTLEIVFDLIIPAPFSVGGCPEKFAVGFFGRWRAERDFYEPWEDAEKPKWDPTDASPVRAPLLPKALR